MLPSVSWEKPCEGLCWFSGVHMLQERKHCLLCLRIPIIPLLEFYFFGREDKDKVLVSLSAGLQV